MDREQHSDDASQKRRLFPKKSEKEHGVKNMESQVYSMISTRDESPQFMFEPKKGISDRIIFKWLLIKPDVFKPCPGLDKWVPPNIDRVIPNNTIVQRMSIDEHSKSDG
ncbi:MAG: hypothetical protein V1673_01635 [Candidatus Omnitrophota bacterium]